jgi:thermostable 8-oxoguanine DNA glycosylase
MADEDREAALELASGMGWADALKFLRSESVIESLVSGRHILIQIARKYPDSVLAKSYAEHERANGR